MMVDNVFHPTVFDVPKSKNTRGYDVYSRLLEDRIIFVSGVVEQTMADSIVAQLLFLESKDKEAPIWLYINSPGGSVIDGLSIIDTMRFIKPKVGTLVTGLAASMGFMILSSGEKGMRKSLPNASIMLHKVSSGARGHIEDMRISYEHSKMLNDRLMEMIGENVGMSTVKVHKVADRDVWLTPKEALKFGKLGVIDEVL